MKKIQIAGLVLVAVFVTGVVTVSAASALEYLVSGVAVKSPEKISVSFRGILTLEDMGKGSPTEIDCEFTGTGVVEAAGKDLLETAGTATSCVTLAGTCSSPSVKVIHLPWATQIEGERNLFSNGGNGEPGFESTCFGIVHDTCTGTTSAALENLPLETPPDLLAIFSATLSEPLNCTLGGAKEGLIIGEVLVAAAGGLSLAIS
jgi:hypothetical protein